MADPAVKRHGDRIEIGDTVRVERGPVLRQATATAALLANDKTAEHYHLPRVEGEGDDAKTIVSRDAFGKPIEEGKRFSYLDYLGDAVFYVFERVEIDATDPRFERFAPVNDPAAQMLPEGSENVQVYSYVFEERGTYPTEDEAVATGVKLAAGTSKEG
jgi:hypothetical protein